jgi:hypothetical protein
MFKLASFVLSATLGVAAVANSAPAEAQTVVGVGVALPGVTVVDPPVVAYVDPFYAYAGVYPGFVGYGYGYHHGWG